MKQESRNWTLDAGRRKAIVDIVNAARKRNGLDPLEECIADIVTRAVDDFLREYQHRKARKENQADIRDQMRSLKACIKKLTPETRRRLDKMLAHLAVYSRDQNLDLQVTTERAQDLIFGKASLTAEFLLGVENALRNTPARPGRALPQHEFSFIWRMGTLFKQRTGRKPSASEDGLFAQFVRCASKDHQNRFCLRKTLAAALKDHAPVGYI